MGIQRRSWWQKIQQHPFIATGIVTVLIVLIAFAFLVHMFGWDWTGFTGGYSKITTTSTTHGITTTTEQPLKRTLWDWLQLFIIPVVLVVAGFWLNHLQKSREDRATEQRAELERKAAEQQAELERELTRDNQQETLLQAYIGKMSELLLREHLGELEPEYKQVRNVARVHTLTILARLDPTCKGSLLKFLYESGLIDIVLIVE